MQESITILKQINLGRPQNECCISKLPVWPAAVDRLRSSILYTVHGYSCRNAIPGLSYSSLVFIYTGAQSCCAVLSNSNPCRLQHLCYYVTENEKLCPTQGSDSYQCQGRLGLLPWLHTSGKDQSIQRRIGTKVTGRVCVFYNWNNDFRRANVMSTLASLSAVATSISKLKSVGLLAIA